MFVKVFSSLSINLLIYFAVASYFRYEMLKETCMKCTALMAHYRACFIVTGHYVSPKRKKPWLVADYFPSEYSELNLSTNVTLIIEKWALNTYSFTYPFTKRNLPPTTVHETILTLPPAHSHDATRRPNVSPNISKYTNCVGQPPSWMRDTWWFIQPPWIHIMWLSTHTTFHKRHVICHRPSLDIYILCKTTKQSRPMSLIQW